jgi:hypothetical protein
MHPCPWTYAFRKWKPAVVSVWFLLLICVCGVLLVPNGLRTLFSSHKAGLDSFAVLNQDIGMSEAAWSLPGPWPSACVDMLHRTTVYLLSGAASTFTPTGANC